MTFINAVLRSEGELSIGQRELIAAYVSGLNACTFCLGSHKIYAKAFGIEEATLSSLLEDVDTASIDESMKPIFKYIQKLNTLPSRMVPTDSQAVFDAGWSETALFEAIEVCSVFNMMNRIVEGTGVNFDYNEDPAKHTIQSPSPDALANSYILHADKIEALVAQKSA
ncbi:MAG: peroxidase [Pseudomonadota bacterium]